MPIPEWLKPYVHRLLSYSCIEIENKHREEVEATLCTLYDLKLRSNGMLMLRRVHILTWKNSQSTFCIDLELLKELK